jgi:SAM-dependent methyltransferase
MTAIRACRACGGSDLPLVLSLGTTPLANALVDPARASEPEPRHPLELVLCTRCSLLQITETVPPEVLFRDYRYFSSFSDTMLGHASAIASRMADELRLGSGSLAAEIASNDGYLLRSYVARGIPVLGIEPARNVAKVAEQNGVRTIPEFFGRDLASRLDRRADVLHANNVMAHVPAIDDVVAGIALFLAPGGVFVTESPYARRMIEHVEFDTIYHEHVFYWSLTAQDAIYAKHGLEIVDVEELPIHGGSIRTFVRHAGSGRRTDAVRRMLDDEAEWGVASARPYRAFADRVGALGRDLVAMLRGLRGEGRRVAAYGAAAKGSTLLNTFGIGTDLIEFVADRSTHKQGLLMPGVRVPVVAADELARRAPDYCLLLTWNFAEEILAQQSAYRDNGGRFIVPVPEVRVV